MFRRGVSNLIDNDYKVKTKELKKFYPVPDDKYQVQITDVNLVTAVSPFSNKEEERLKFEFTILTEKDWEYVDEEGAKQIENTHGRRLWKWMSPSLSSGGKQSRPSWLYKMLCAIEGKELSESELVEFSPNTLVGRQVQVMVAINGEYNNILAFSHADKDLEAVPNADQRPEKVDESVEVDDINF